MSQFIYNSISLGLIKTNSVDRQIRLSDDNTEYMWTDFTIDLTCVYSPSPLATSYPAVGDLPVETDNYVRFLLMQPRRPLYYAEGGAPILDIPANQANGDAIDCENGPIPQACSVVRIASSRLFYVRFVIKASILECPPNSFASAIASNRYSRSESIDTQYRSTLVTSGVAKFRSNVLAAIGQTADDFRGYVIPPPIAGYQRKAVNIGLSPSGISFEYTTVDVEQFIDLGSPAIAESAASTGIVEMDLEYSTAGIPTGDIGISGIKGVTATVQSMAVGTKEADMLSMLIFLVRCSINKLGNLFTTGLLTGSAVTENPFRRTVSLSMTVTVYPGNGQPAGVPMGIIGYVGQPIAFLPNLQGIEPQPPFSNSTRGFTSYEVAVNAIATACYTQISEFGGCDGTGSVPGDLSLPSNQCYGTPGYGVYLYTPLEPVLNTNDNRQPGQTQRGPDPQIGTYGKYTVRDDYETNSGIKQVPTAPPGEAPNPSYYNPGSMYPAPSNPGSNYPASSSPTPTPTPSPSPTSTPTSTSTQTPMPTPTSVALQLFQPYTRRVVSWSIERFGCIPEVPDPTPTLDGYAVLSITISPVAMDEGIDGSTPIYRISGCYVYSLSLPVNPADPVPFSIPPWMNVQPDQNTQLIASDYTTGIIDNPVDTSNNNETA